MASSALDNKRVAKNTLFLSVRMLLVMFVTLYTSRVILEALGVENFGIYNVIGGVISLFAFVNGAMSNATQRFIAFEIGKGEQGEIQRVFCGCMMIHILIATIIFAFAETIGLYIVNHYLTIPAEKMVAANWVYQISIVSCMVMVVNSPYNGAIVAFERMQAFAYISIIDVVLKLGVAFMIMYTEFDKLITYAFLLFVVQLCVRLSYTIYCHRNLPQIRFFLIWDKTLFKQLSGFMGWTLFNNLSIIACTQGINIVLNIFFNPVVNAARGIALQVQHAVTMFSQNFQMAINPQIVKSYSMNEKEHFYNLIFSSSRLSFMLLLLLAFPILTHIDYILSLWLTEVPDHTAKFTVLVILVSLVEVLANPLLAGVSAQGVIKYFQLVSGLLLITILPISALGFSYIKRPELIFEVYLAMSIVVYLYKLYYSMRHLGFSLKDYWVKVMGQLLGVSFISLVFFYFANSYNSKNFFYFIVGFSSTLTFEAFLIWFIGLTKQERNSFVRAIEKKLRSFIDHTINMFSKLYSSNLVFILLFIVSIIVDNVNGILQDMGLYTPIGAIFRIGILAFLLPCFLRLTGNQRYFLYYVLLITILFLVGLGFWTINNYTINTMVEIDAFIRLMYFYAVIAYFLVYVRNSSALKYVEYYVLTISAIVLISFITGIGNASYGETYGFGMKGYFIAGNDLGLSMVLSLLLLSISYFDRLNLKNILKLFVIVLACFALGSRVGMLGSILIIFYLSFYYIFLYSPKIQSLQSSFKKILLSLFVFLTIILTLGWIYNNAFDAYAKKRLTSKSLSSARSVLTEPAKRKIRDFSTTELFIGGGQVALLSKVANDNNLFMERRAIEADYWEIIGSYGYFLGGMIYSIAVFPIMFSLFSYYHNRTLTTLTLLLFFCLFCMIGFLAGHAIKNLMVAPVFAYAMSALFNKFDIYNNSIS